ncbi:MAG TPA: hypothetical protein VMI56_08615 [Reyranella sp.]|nr:hypothetical protein [Reyranella sp.]
MTRVALLLSLLLPVPALADCPLDLGHGTGWVVFSQHYMIAFRPDPLRIETNEPLALVLNVCTKEGEAAELVAVAAGNLDVQGPEQHLKIVPGAEGRYRAEGLLLSTVGHWEIDFDVRSGGDSERLSHEIVVK